MAAMCDESPLVTRTHRWVADLTEQNSQCQFCKQIEYPNRELRMPKKRHNVASTTFYYQAKLTNKPIVDFDVLLIQKNNEPTSFSICLLYTSPSPRD